MSDSFLNSMTFTKTKRADCTDPDCDDCDEVPEDLKQYIVDYKKRKILSTASVKGDSNGENSNADDTTINAQNFYDNIDSLAAFTAFSKSNKPPEKQVRTLLHRAKHVTCYHQTLPVGAAPLLEYSGGRDRIVALLIVEKKSSSIKEGSNKQDNRDLDVKSIGRGVIGTNDEYLSRKSLSWVNYGDDSSSEEKKQNQPSADEITYSIKNAMFYKGMQTNMSAVGWINNSEEEVQFVAVKDMSDGKVVEFEEGCNATEVALHNLVKKISSRCGAEEKDEVLLDGGELEAFRGSFVEIANNNSATFPVSGTEVKSDSGTKIATLTKL